jgi:hypothetical protein
MKDEEIGEGKMESEDLRGRRERELEEEIGVALRALPYPKAPPTLFARVMQGVQEAESLPWYRAGWFYWPMRLRALSLALMGALVVGGVVGIPALMENAGLSIGSIEGQFLDLFAPALGMAAVLRVGIVALGAMVGAVPPQAIGLVGVGAILMMAMTIVVGAALRRLSPDWEMFS